MNRRGHLSHKIPNVKLRPAPAGPSKRRRDDDGDMREHAWADVEEEGLTSDAMRENRKPWADVVVTFTGVENKGELGPLVRAVGGEVELALTINTTHVIAAGYTTDKYFYAIENGIPVMAPDWIHDSYNKWEAGEEVDMEQSIEMFRLQPFFGLTIAVTGVDNIERRKQIVAQIRAHGGNYSKDLDRNCTHLVSAHWTLDPKGRSSDKVKWALKELGERDAKRRAGKRVEERESIKIVYEEWLWDCIAYKGRWKEENYDARKARKNGKAKAEDVLSGNLPKLGKEAKHDEPEPVVIKRRKKDGMDGLVGDILSVTPVVKTDPADIKPDIKTDADAMNVDPKGEAAAALLARTSAFERKPSVLHASRSTSFQAQPSAAGPSREPDTSTTAASGRPLSDMSLPSSARFSGGIQPPATASGAQMFGGLKFSHTVAEGFGGLENALRQHGGEVVPEADRLQGAEVDYVIVRLSSKTRPFVEPGKSTQVVTECWVEGCCFEKKILDPATKLFFRPLAIPTPVPGAASLVVHISGFSTENSVYLKRLLRALGGVYSEKLNRAATHLVCAAPAGQKYFKANEWGVKVVQQSWLLRMGEKGVVPSEEEHRHEVGEGQRKPVAANLMAQLSMHPDVGDALNLQAPVSRAAAVCTSQQSHPRALQATPTHLNDISPNNVDAERNGSEPALARLAADGRDKAVARTVSAPPEESVRSAMAEAAESGDKAAKAATVLGIGRKEGMTEMLRSLAERGDEAGKNKAARRPPRPFAARPRTSTSTPFARPASPEPPSPEPPQPKAQEESMRVTYADPAADKEKRRLLDAILKAGGG
ncbi:protein kinase activating protein dpb11 [Cryptotrichosporon argae]